MAEKEEESLDDLSPSRRAAAIALGARAAEQAGKAVATDVATRTGEAAREEHLKKGLEEAQQLKYQKAAGRDSRAQVGYVKQLLEGKRGSAPARRAGISKQMIDEIIDDLSPDDLGPDLRKYYDDFSLKEARRTGKVGPRGVPAADWYTLRFNPEMDASVVSPRDLRPAPYQTGQQGTLWAKHSDDVIEGLDPADRYIVARLKALEGNKDAAKVAKGLGEQIFSGVKAGVAEMAANPARTAKTAAKGLAAAFSVVPDLSDILMLAAAAPTLGAQELGRREDLERQLDLIAPARGASERQPATADQLSNSQRAQIRDFVLNAASPMAAARKLVQERNYITQDALDEIIAD